MQDFITFLWLNTMSYTLLNDTNTKAPVVFIIAKSNLNMYTLQTVLCTTNGANCYTQATLHLEWVHQSNLIYT